MIRKEVINNFPKTRVARIFDMLEQGVPNDEINRRLKPKGNSHHTGPEQSPQSNPKKKVIHALNDISFVSDIDSRHSDNDSDFVVSTKPLHKERPLKIKVKIATDKPNQEKIFCRYGNTQQEVEAKLLREGLVIVDGSQEKSVLRSELLQKIISIRRLKEYGNFLIEINKQKRRSQHKENFLRGNVSVENVGRAIFQSPLLMGIYICEMFGFEDVYKKHDLVVFIDAFKNGDPLAVGIQVKSSERKIKTFFSESRSNHYNPDEFYKNRFIVLNGQNPDEKIFESFNSQLSKIIDYESSKY